MLLLITSGIHAQFGPMPSAGSMGMPAMPGGAAQNFGGPGQAGPAAGMPMPSEQELEQILKMIEQAAAENPELIKEWERQGQREILKMSPADLSAFGQMVGIAPEVLREEAEKALADELGAAAMSPVAAAEEEYTPQRPTAAQKIEQPSVPKPSKSDTQQTSVIVKGLIQQLADLQAKAASVREVHEVIRAWIQELRELMFYARVIDRHEYHQHLSLAKFKSLLSALSNLYSTLRTEVPNIALPDDLLEEQNAYDLLGVKKSAKDSAIDAAYERLVEKHNPKKLEKELRAQGLDEKAIKQQVKKATLSFEAVEDAYEQLHTPQLRAQIDREIKAHKSLKQQKIAQATQALSSIRQALEEAVYGDEILFKLEQFLQDYAPQQLALKKTLEDAEKKRLEEQKKQASITPTVTYGTFEPEVRYTQPSSYDDYGYSSNYNPYSDYGNYYDNYPNYSYASEQDSTPSSSAGSAAPTPGAGEKKEKGEGEEKDAKKPSGKAPSPEKIQQARQIDERNPEDIIKSIDKNFDEFLKKYMPSKTDASKAKPGAPKQDSPYKKTLSDFQNKLKITTKTVPAAEEEEEEEIKETEEGEEITEEAAEVTLPETIQEQSDVSKDFEKIRKDLKIDVLAQETENLFKIFKKLELKNAEQEKGLTKLADKIESNKKAIPSLQSELTKIEPLINEDINAKNYEAFTQLKNDVDLINENFETIRNNYANII